MRSAGCVANDLADQSIDKCVKRTKNRQLVLKNITNQSAFIFLLSLLALSFFLVLQLNMYTIHLSILACISALIYPFFKRFFMIPQLFLGITFSFGILLAFAAVQNTITLEGWLLFIANLLWVLGYDSHYALVDLEDDKKINIYSSAQTFGKFTPILIIISFIFMYLIYFYFGHNNEYSNVGKNPDISRGDLSPILIDIAQGDMPDIIWDGLLPISELFFGQPQEEKIIIKEADETNFLDLDVFWYVAFPFFHSPSRDKNEFEGSITNLPKISKWN